MLSGISVTISPWKKNTHCTKNIDAELESKWVTKTVKIRLYTYPNSRAEARELKQVWERDRVEGY